MHYGASSVVNWKLRNCNATTPAHHSSDVNYVHQQKIRFVSDYPHSRALRATMGFSGVCPPSDLSDCLSDLNMEGPQYSAQQRSFLAVEYYKKVGTYGRDNR